jgi:iron complex transport system ATP-binding protein
VSLLRLSGLTVTLGGRRVVDGACTTVHPGEVVGLIGPNGAGKTSLMRAVLGLIPCAGDIHISGEPTSELTPRQLARQVAYLPQDREISWAVTVETVVALGRTPYRSVAAGLSARDRSAIDDAMAQMDVETLRHRVATELSGGERARVLLARLLAQETPLVLADEPTAGLDPAHQIDVMATFADLAADGRGVLVSLHDLALAARWCHRLVVLDRGQVLAEGPPERVLTAERLAEVYGITAHMDRHADHLIVLPTGRTVGRHAE